MMVGGDKNAYEFIKPILMPWQNPNGGFEYFGEGGAGHFIKNGSQCYRIRNNAINGEGFGSWKNHLTI